MHAPVSLIPSPFPPAWKSEHHPSLLLPHPLASWLQQRRHQLTHGVPGARCTRCLLPSFFPPDPAPLCLLDSSSRPPAPFPHDPAPLCPGSHKQARMNYSTLCALHSACGSARSRGSTFWSSCSVYTPRFNRGAPKCCDVSPRASTPNPTLQAMLLSWELRPC